MRRPNWLAGFVDFFAVQKFRFDIAASFLVFVNFGLLVIADSPQIQSALEGFGVHLDMISLIALIIAVVFASMWLFGFSLDKVGYWHGLLSVQNKRNPQLSEILRNTQELQREVEELKSMIKRMEDG